ncbi:hypothetical protein [Hydrogenophaga pseudoflava]|uniref:hypothetical protein n=1 Tax=Hydrogenophaga pseudoflava TaxID=47421 RepID=UPI0010570A7D|nr:hypothetical protein [Hydrogenophaga pseudoflava]
MTLPSALARDLDLDIFPSAEPERVAPAQPVKPREGVSRPAVPVRPEADVNRQAQQPAAPGGSKSVPARSAEDRLKKAREAEALFTLETTDLPALKQRDPTIECYGELCVTKRASLVGFRGMNVCLSDVSIEVKSGRIVGALCDIALTTARDMNAVLSDLLGSPTYTKRAISAHATWVADKRKIEIVYWKGTNIHGVPYEKWSVDLGER